MQHPTSTDRTAMALGRASGPMPAAIDAAPAG